MMYAADSSGTKMEALKGRRAFCPYCKGEVIAKCGEIKKWHWSHTLEAKCDSWAEPETDWHLYWKSLVPKENAEVVISNDGITHRADILTDDGCVVELQHSPLLLEDLRNRESFYCKMIWLFDIRRAYTRLRWITRKANPHWIREEDRDWILRCGEKFAMRHNLPENSEWKKFSHWQHQCRRLLELFPDLGPKEPKTFGEMVPLWIGAVEKQKFNARRIRFPGADHFVWTNPWTHIVRATKPKYLHLDDNALFKVTNFRASSSRFDGTVNTTTLMENWLRRKCRGNPKLPCFDRMIA